MDGSLSSLLADSRLHLKRGESVTPPCGYSGLQNSHGFPILSAGHIHEWHSTETLNQCNAWFPPMTLLTLLAFSLHANRRILWIGRRCWPTFQLLCSLSGDEAPRKILARSIFLDPLTDAERFWAIGEGLRCKGMGCVVADGSGMSSTMSRRLQLAAESANAVGLFARPYWEVDEPFCAGTRWHVQSLDSSTDEPKWLIELQRCRGQRQEALARWIVGWNYRVFIGTGALHFSSDVGHKPAATQVGTHDSGRYKIA